MSSSDSPTSAITTSSSTSPTPGLLWAAVNIQDIKNRATPADFENWYVHEHMGDVLNSQVNLGGGDLFLRYLQADPSIDCYDNPDYESRIKNPETTMAAVAKMGWAYLALVKIGDIPWLTSEAFDAIPRTSKYFPKHEDGSIGSGFTFAHVALRAYETVAKGVGKSKGEGRAKWMVSLQIESGENEALKRLGHACGEAEECRSWIAYTLRDGMLGYPEPGLLPRGMILVDMDAEPKLGQEKGIVRRDVWNFTMERGDPSLSL